MKSKTKGLRNGAKSRILKHLSRGPSTYRRMVAAKLSNSEGALAVMLTYLTQRGEVRRVSRGLYALP